MRPLTSLVGLLVGHRGIGWMLASLGLLGGAVGVNPGVTASHVVGRVGSITVTATTLQPERSDTLTSDLRLTTSGAASDQLDTALAAGNAAVSVYHRQVSVGEIPDLASCDGEVPSQVIVEQWLHEGPLLVPGRAYGDASPASATLMVPTAGVSVHQSLAITLYFAHAGELTLDLPVRSA
jgi:hypothetical protein